LVKTAVISFEQHLESEVLPRFCDGRETRLLAINPLVARRVAGEDGIPRFAPDQLKLFSSPTFVKPSTMSDLQAQFESAAATAKSFTKPNVRVLMWWSHR
jgi:hypothetical protein